jgi:hypothetical protein
MVIRNSFTLSINSRFHVTRGDFVVIAAQPIRIRGKIVSHNLRQSTVLLYEDLSRYACFTRFLRVSFNMVNTCAWGNRKSDSRYHKRIFGVMFIPVSYKLSWNACVRQRWQSKTDLIFVCFKGKLIKFVMDFRIYIFWLWLKIVSRFTIHKRMWHVSCI